MNARLSMRWRAAVTRNTATGTDVNRLPATPAWTAHLTIPCRPMLKAEREARDENKTAIVEDFRLLIPKGLDVTTNDRVSNVTNRKQVVEYAGPYLIDAKLERREHVELILRQIAAA